MQEDAGRICPHCGKVIAADRKQYCNHCGEIFVDLADANRQKIEDLFRAAGQVIVRSYPGRNQDDAAKLYQTEASIASPLGFSPVSQSWAAGRAGVARMLLLGLYADVARPNGFLTVTFIRGGPTGEKETR